MFLCKSSHLKVDLMAFQFDLREKKNDRIKGHGEVLCSPGFTPPFSAFHPRENVDTNYLKAKEQNCMKVAAGV